MAKGGKEAKANKKTKQKGQDKAAAPPPPAQEPVAVDPPEPVVVPGPSPPPPEVVPASEPEAIASNGEGHQDVPGMSVRLSTPRKLSEMNGSLTMSLPSVTLGL